MITFNLHRFLCLVKRDWVVYKKHLLSIVVILLSLCALYMLISKENLIRRSISVEHTFQSILYIEILYLTMLSIVGFFVTMLVFKDFRTPQDRLQFLQLPASNFEKVLSKWLYSLPGMWLLTAFVFIFGYTLFGAIIESYTEVVYPSLKWIRWEMIGNGLVIYTVVHSVLFLLAMIFNRFVIPKSIISLVILTILTLIILGVIIRVIMFNHFDGWSMRGDEFSLSFSFQDRAKWFLEHLHYLGLYIVVPFLWLVSFLKMKEKEL